MFRNAMITSERYILFFLLNNVLAEYYVKQKQKQLNKRLELLTAINSKMNSDSITMFLASFEKVIKVFYRFWHNCAKDV